MSHLRLASIAAPYSENSEVHNLLSDLFYNYDHDFKKLGLYECHAVYEAAQDFLDAYSLIISCELPSAQELTDDYFAREQAF